MPIDLTGIQNENEFYSDHYLTTVFEGDIKETIDRWNQLKEEGGKAPHQDLGALATPYIRAATEYRDTRDGTERVQMFRQFTYDLLNALGYERQLQQPILSDGTWLPALCRARRSDRSDHLWIVETLAPAGDDFVTDPLALDVPEELGPADLSALPECWQGAYEDAITVGIFGLDQPPRFVLLVSMAQATLIDRNKWGESRLLRFDFTEIFSRKEPATLQAVTALLHRESLAPDSGTPLIDTIDEESHRHAHGVSKDLKYALREAIELLGNEAAEQTVKRRKAAGEAAYQTRDGKAALDARELSLECLRYMYRLLFLFYIEARPDLGFAPMKSDAYRKGYSLESLRELELMPLASDEEKDGHYLHESLNLLFRLVYDGTPYSDLKSDDEFSRDFDMRPVRTHLFDPDSTPMLSKVRFCNETLQRIIQLMSLSREGQGRRGRISYALLGINQLGAVYEALLSYSGFFAQTDLYEVKKAGEPNPDPLEAAYFVPKADINRYEQNEIVYDGNDPRIYPKGTFIYRLAGRDRQNSASYYTPEVLTRCLVKYTLKERLKDKTADDILKLTICEPAMGSAAFLVEALNQLADAYLAKKQEELGERIPHDRYAYERQNVRAYITDRNTFGVDLNPIAMELGQVSLWLNCIHEGDFIPWFGDQLFAGNSLIGARRDVYPVSQIGKSAKTDDRWFNHEPRPLKSEAPRNADEVYHFLLPDPSMADYKKAIVGPLAPQQFEKLREWRKGFCAPLDSDGIAQLKRLSIVIDELFQENAKALANERKENTDPLTVWGQPDEIGKVTDFKAKNQRLAGMRGEGARNAVPYRRLKTAMDYWCALWFWPLEHVDLLPTRDEFLFDMTLILEGNVLSSGADMFERENLLSGAVPDKVDLFNPRKSYGQVDIQSLKAKSPRLMKVSELAEQARFFHWAVELGDVLLSGDGFDVILGNPPWIKLEFNLMQRASDDFPIAAMRNFKNPKQIENLYPINLRQKYLNEFCFSEMSQAFLSSPVNYYLLKGSKPDLYKNFILQGRKLSSEQGLFSFVHPNGIFDEPSLGAFRESIRPNILYRFQFQNALMLFEIAHRKQYGLYIYGKTKTRNFRMICNLLHPLSIDECFLHDGAGMVHGLKDDDNRWCLHGHKNRIILMDDENSTIMRDVYDPDASSVNSGLIGNIHSVEVLNVLKKITNAAKSLSQIKTSVYTSTLFDENAAQIDEYISRNTHFPSRLDNLVVSGPHFYVNWPFKQTPRRICETHQAYDLVDLSFIENGYIPRSNYSLNSIPSSFNKAAINTFRIFLSRQLSLSAERTLQPSVFPPGVLHIDSVISVSLPEPLLLLACGCWSSLLCDFIVKAKGSTSLRKGIILSLPVSDPSHPLSKEIIKRSYALNAINDHFTDLAAVFENSADATLETHFGTFSLEGDRLFDLSRNYLCRYLLGIEIDCLFSMYSGLSLEEMLTIYRVQFPVLRENEKTTFFDKNGNIAFTKSRNLRGLGLGNDVFTDAMRDTIEGNQSMGWEDDTVPGGPVARHAVFEAPFRVITREASSERAWAFLENKHASILAA